MKKAIIEAAKALCRDLRKNQTRSESFFWEAVRDRRFLGIKFYRQHPLFVRLIDTERFYIADFYSRQQSLAIEIDGKNHDSQKDYDDLRTQVIQTLGVRVVRFKNEEIERDLSLALRRLEEIIGTRNSLGPLL